MPKATVRPYYEQTPKEWAELFDRSRTAGPNARILLKGATVISLDPAIGDFDQGDVLIRGRRIEAVDTDLSAVAADVTCINDCAHNTRDGRMRMPPSSPTPIPASAPFTQARRLIRAFGTSRKICFAFANSSARRIPRGVSASSSINSPSWNVATKGQRALSVGFLGRVLIEERAADLPGNLRRRQASLFPTRLRPVGLPCRGCGSTASPFMASYVAGDHRSTPANAGVVPEQGASTLAFSFCPARLGRSPVMAPSPRPTAKRRSCTLSASLAAGVALHRRAARRRARRR